MPGSPKLRKKLKAWRKAKDYTQQQAADALGVSLGALRDWEQEAKAPRGIALKAVMDALDK